MFAALLTQLLTLEKAEERRGLRCCKFVVGNIEPVGVSVFGLSDSSCVGVSCGGICCWIVGVALNPLDEVDSVLGRISIHFVEDLYKLEDHLVVVDLDCSIIQSQTIDRLSRIS